MNIVKTCFCLFISMILLDACTSPSEKPAAQPATQQEEPKSDIYTIEIAQMQFSPAEIKVKKGDRIVFVNRDIVAHDVTEQNKKWNSSPLQKGEYWTLTVTDSASYYCSIHPVMKGKIAVE